MMVAVLFENTWQATKVRWILWASCVWTAGWLYWASTLADTYGLNPGDGGLLQPSWQRYLVAAFTALAGVLPTAAIVIYCRIYLIRIERQDDDVVLTTLGLFSSRNDLFKRHDFAQIGAFDGRSRFDYSINAPWMTLWVKGCRLPYIIDLQAERVEAQAIRALIPKVNRQRA